MYRNQIAWIKSVNWFFQELFSSSLRRHFWVKLTYPLVKSHVITVSTFTHQRVKGSFNTCCIYNTAWLVSRFAGTFQCWTNLHRKLWIACQTSDVIISILVLSIKLIFYFQFVGKNSLMLWHFWCYKQNYVNTSRTQPR